MTNAALVLPDSATTAPLNTTERSAAPTAPVTGDIYLDDGTNTASTNPGWRRYTGSAWEDVSAVGGTDAAAIHDNVAAEISVVTEKTTPVSADVLLIEDSAAANVKKRVQIGNLPADVGDHGARAYHNASQSIPNTTLTALALNSERWDTDAYHDLVTNNSRLTVPSGQAGKYYIAAGAQFAGNSTGLRKVGIYLNGITIIKEQQMTVPGGAAMTLSVSTIYDLAVSDYVECVVSQTSGGALNINAIGNSTPEFVIQRIS